MIVGGGDLSIADEALKHKAVKEVVLVDIDGRVVELCREHFARDQRQSVQGQAAQDRDRRRVRISGKAREQRPLRPHRRRPPRSRGPRQGAVRRDVLRPRERRAEAGRLRHVPDGRAVLSALGDHRRAEGAGGILPAIGSLSDGGAELYRRLHGAVLGRQAASRSARRQASSARVRPSRSRRSRRTITIPKPTRHVSRCPNGSSAWCRKPHGALRPSNFRPSSPGSPIERADMGETS